MRKKSVRGTVLVGIAMALCCVGVTGAADPEGVADGRTGVSSPFVRTGADDWPPSWAIGAEPPKADFWHEAETTIVRLVNEERSKAGCAPLKTHGSLTRAAREHSQDMARRGALGHVGSDGTSASDRVRATGYKKPAGEIIADGYETPEKAVRAWKESPGHRRALLNCSLVDTGVGVVRADDGPYWTQVFGYGP
ncbi:CAP domain-containing protein [Nocardiopsis sp. N85]|uniref:CAP domain-containing protein n=1 Tax=Nocardiopsis sp. N85 TaxID=3029400 RepID=UPI00237F23BC|nr:CAP domain-containing protein [Nocardiopsis sp. N85]MDE3724976.1 CAP domain-containing protein [Nocardiopsis sp. N85]